MTEEKMIGEKPPPEHVDCAVALLVHPEQYRLFFEWLKNPEWIEPLRERGFFTRPPGPGEKGTPENDIPLWPESQYLARMASKRPELVMEILVRLPDNHGNIRVYEDIADAALSMPPEYAAVLAKKIILRLEGIPHPSLFARAEALAADLAQGGMMEEALALTDRLIEALSLLAPGDYKE